VNPDARALRPTVLRGLRPYGGEATDLLIRDGIIERVGRDIDPGDALVLDAAGLIAIPGLVDLHTHLREPGTGRAETIETGTRAAVAGGYAAVFAMANTDPVADNCEIVELVARRSAAAGWCDVYPVGAVTVGLEGKVMADLESMATSAARVRVFSDDGHCVDDAALSRETLRRTAAIGGVFAQHAQCERLAGNGQVHEGMVSRARQLAPWPGVAEETIIARDLVLLAEAAPYGARLHVCHVSTARSVALLRMAKERGLPVTAEVTPHHLALVDLAGLSGETRFKVNPPLRGPEDVTAVRDGLADGTIDIVATDHAPHEAAAKAQDWPDAPPGMIGLETALAVVAETMVHSGRMTWRDIARVMSERPAEIGQVSDVHGRGLQPGEPANICLVDASAQITTPPATGASMSDNTPFTGFPLSSTVTATLVRGRVCFDPRGIFAEGIRQ
jgi:dihydroorotase